MVILRTEFAEFVESCMNDQISILKENKSAYVRLESLITLDLLFQLIRKYHLDVKPPERELYKKLLNLTRVKRHFFQVRLGADYLEKEFNSI